MKKLLIISLFVNLLFLIALTILSFYLIKLLDATDTIVRDNEQQVFKLKKQLLQEVKRKDPDAIEAKIFKKNIEFKEKWNKIRNDLNSIDKLGNYYLSNEYPQRKELFSMLINNLDIYNASAEDIDKYLGKPDSIKKVDGVIFLSYKYTQFLENFTTQILVKNKKIESVRIINHGASVEKSVPIGSKKSSVQNDVD